MRPLENLNREHDKKLTEGKERASGTKKQKESKAPVLKPDGVKRSKCCRCPIGKEHICCGCNCHVNIPNKPLTNKELKKVFQAIDNNKI